MPRRSANKRTPARAAEPTPPAPELSPPDPTISAEEEPTPEAPPHSEERDKSQQPEKGPVVVASVMVKEEVVAEEAVVVVNMVDEFPNVETEEEEADVAERAAGEKDPLPEAVEPVDDREEDR